MIRINPVLLVADNDVANRLFVRRVLSAAGWIVVEAMSGEETVATAHAASPNLILMEFDMPREGGIEATHQIRASARTLASVPILAFTTLRVDDAEVRAIGMDGRVAKPCTQDVLMAATAPWRPDGEMDGAHRLADVFGAAALAPLIANFRAQLAQAVAQLDAGDIATAHRIAGVAGTLGFAAVSASWVRLSQGETEAFDQARRAARMAISQIDRYPFDGAFCDLAP